jgi:hypothetical protein
MAQAGRSAAELSKRLAGSRESAVVAYAWAAAPGIAIGLLLWKVGAERNAAFGIGLFIVAIRTALLDRRLQGAARRFQLGALGERKVARRVRFFALRSRLTGRRVIALHDRAVPGSQANIDHVVISRHGVSVLDAKVRRRHRWSITNEQLWYEGHPLDPKRKLRWEAEHVRDALDDAGYEHVPLQAYWVLSGTFPYIGEMRFEDATAVRVRFLGRAIRNRREVLSDNDVRSIAEHLRKALAPRTTADA